MKKMTDRQKRFSLRHIVALVFGATMLLLIMPALMFFMSAFLSLEFLPSTKIGHMLGALISGAGLFFILWANIELHVKGHGGAAVVGKIKLMPETDALVTTGPYAMCRNPMHTGLVIYYTGIAFTLNNLVCMLFAVFFGVCALLFAVYIDEPRLMRDFGKEFERWREITPRFIPKIKKPFSN